MADLPFNPEKPLQNPSTSPWEKQRLKLWNWLLFDFLMILVESALVIISYEITIKTNPDLSIWNATNIVLAIVTLICLISALMLIGVFIIFNITSLIGVIQYRQLKKLLENEDFEEVKKSAETKLKQYAAGTSSDSSPMIDFIMNKTYNDKECAIAALSELEGKEIDELLFTLAFGKKKTIASKAIKALEYRAVKRGFQSLGDYQEYLQIHE